MNAEPNASGLLRAVIAICVIVAATANAVRADSDGDNDFFEKRIRPILVDRCEGCHSAGTGKTSGGLALDSKAGWMKGGESGSTVVPGEPENSLIIRAVNYSSDGPQMPPKDKGGKLPETEIAALTEWVKRGAPDPRTKSVKILGMTAEEVRTWWSFQKVRRVEPPVVENDRWPRTEVDRFILAELEKRNLTLSEPADKRTLLRRVTYDLTGLPPTVAEMDAFLADSADDAFDRAVNRLLDSPAYGERWTRHWLDVARYADFYDANPKTRTASCELTEAWRYRDWVVDSLNKDLPYDQFIRHQIAGDTMPNPSGLDVYPEGLIATTFLSNGVWDRGDADKEKIISDMADDNIDTVGKAFLGLTLGCARCHDHKFDPVSTEDYYALAGIFYSSHILKDLGAKGAEYDMNRVPLVSKSVLAERDEKEARLKETQAKLDSLVQQHRLEKLSAGGTVLVPSQIMTSPASVGSIAPEGVITVSGPESKDSYTIKAKAPSGEPLRFVRLEAISDPALPGKGPGRAANGNFMINRFSLLFVPPGESTVPTPVVWASATADFEQKGRAVAGAIDDKPESGWGIEPLCGTNHIAVFEISKEVNIPAGSTLTFIIDQTHSDKSAIGKLRLSVTHIPAVLTAPTDPEQPKLTALRDQLQKDLSVPLPLAMAVQEGGMRGGLFPNIQDVPIHIRGSYTKLGPVIPRRMPRFLAGDQQAPIANGSGRRELANWVASPDNPLTARVIVNRFWQWHFGEGLVRTPSNFGKMGEAPSHPELLDWLATKLVDDGWSLKSLHRRILRSATYQQASRVSSDAIQNDPENRWFGRFVPRRLEAETIRDAMLFVAGQLDRTAGGSADDDFTSLRRSLYIQTARWDRSSYSMLFDAANPDSSTEKRITSTVAPQALLLLNHDFILNQAKSLTNRLFEQVPDDETKRVQFAFQLLYGRPVHDDELSIARKIVGSSSNEDRSGWIDLAHMLLCSNEFVYLD